MPSGNTGQIWICPHYLSVLDVDLVAAEDDGDVLADAHQVAVPIGHVLVRHPGRHVEHDDGALALKLE